MRDTNGYTGEYLIDQTKTTKAESIVNPANPNLQSDTKVSHDEYKDFVEQEFAVGDMLPQEATPVTKQCLNISPHLSSRNSMSHFTHTHIGDLSSLPELQIYEYGPSENISRRSQSRTPRSMSGDVKRAVSIVRVLKNMDPSNFTSLPPCPPEGDDQSCTSIAMTPRDHLNVRACAPISGNLGDG